LNKFYRTLGHNIRAERQRQDIAGTTLARQIGVTHVALIKYEMGRVRVPLEAFVKIAYALGMTTPAESAPLFSDINWKGQTNGTSRRKR
jgi:transcriptional regulator with XRE-family HTH domain